MNSIGTEAWWIITTAVSLAIGTITYFLKRTMSAVDKNGADIHGIQLTYVTKQELKTCKADLEQDTDDIKASLTARVEELESSVDNIRDKYLTKDDFYRTQANTDKKLDKMYDLLLQMSKGGKGNG